MNAYVERILRTHLDQIISGLKVAVPDDAEEMNWRLFFAHSQDMQGFAADIFTGGPHERTNPFDPGYWGLRTRWKERSTVLINGLGQLWRDKELRTALERATSRRDRNRDGRPSVTQLLELLRSRNNPAAHTFVDAVSELKGHKVAFKTAAMLRSYIQNSAMLADGYHASFREYLHSFTNGRALPTSNLAALESRWVYAIERGFYNVGPALANYMICDWLLFLWREGRIDWFQSYKPDSVHLSAVERGLLPAEASHSFVEYCRSITIPSRFGGLSGRPCPPRVLNECIWLEENTSSGPASRSGCGV